MQAFNTKFAAKQWETAILERKERKHLECALAIELDSFCEMNRIPLPNKTHIRWQAVVDGEDFTESIPTIAYRDVTFALSSEYAFGMVTESPCKKLHYFDKISNLADIHEILKNSKFVVEMSDLPAAETLLTGAKS